MVDRMIFLTCLHDMAGILCSEDLKDIHDISDIEGIVGCHESC